jgi:hypothetical protein
MALGSQKYCFSKATPQTQIESHRVRRRMGDLAWGASFNVAGTMLEVPPGLLPALAVLS